jgi:hypothetical protein
MHKIYDIDHDHATGAPVERRRREGAADRASDGRGIVHCFVATGELRRLLSLLAGTELLRQLAESITASSGKAELPPTLF